MTPVEETSCALWSSASQAFPSSSPSPCRPAAEPARPGSGPTAEAAGLAPVAPAGAAAPGCGWRLRRERRRGRVRGRRARLGRGVQGRRRRRRHRHDLDDHLRKHGHPALLARPHVQRGHGPRDLLGDERIRPTTAPSPTARSTPRATSTSTRRPSFTRPRCPRLPAPRRPSPSAAASPSPARRTRASTRSPSRRRASSGRARRSSAATTPASSGQSTPRAARRRTSATSAGSPDRPPARSSRSRATWSSTRTEAPRPASRPSARARRAGRSAPQQRLPRRHRHDGATDRVHLEDACDVAPRRHLRGQQDLRGPRYGLRGDLRPGAWDSNVYGFTRVETSTDAHPPQLISISTTSGVGSIDHIHFSLHDGRLVGGGCHHDRHGHGAAAARSSSPAEVGVARRAVPFPGGVRPCGILDPSPPPWPGYAANLARELRP